VRRVCPSAGCQAALLGLIETLFRDDADTKEPSPIAVLAADVEWVSGQRRRLAEAHSALDRAFAALVTGA